jgi:hypothetical protein
MSAPETPTLDVLDVVEADAVRALDLYRAAFQSAVPFATTRETSATVQVHAMRAALRADRATQAEATAATIAELRRQLAAVTLERDTLRADLDTVNALALAANQADADVIARGQAEVTRLRDALRAASAGAQRRLYPQVSGRTQIVYVIDHVAYETLLREFGLDTLHTDGRRGCGGGSDD